jgi:hypothetical protein
MLSLVLNNCRGLPNNPNVHGRPDHNPGRGVAWLDDPVHNKGTAFTAKRVSISLCINQGVSSRLRLGALLGPDRPVAISSFADECTVATETQNR